MYLFFHQGALSWILELWGRPGLPKPSRGYGPVWTSFIRKQCSTAQKSRKSNTGYLRAKKVDKSIYIQNQNFLASPSLIYLWFKLYMFPVLIFSSTVYLMFLTYHFWGAHGAYYIKFSAHAQFIRTRKFLLRKSWEGFDTEIQSIKYI